MIKQDISWKKSIDPLVQSIFLASQNDYNKNDCCILTLRSDDILKLKSVCLENVKMAPLLEDFVNVKKRAFTGVKSKDCNQFTLYRL